MMSNSITKRTKASIHKASIDDAISIINLCQSNNEYHQFFGDEYSLISMTNADLLKGALKDDYTSQAIKSDEEKVKFRSFLTCEETRVRVLCKMERALEIISNESKSKKNKKTKDYYKKKYQKDVGDVLSTKIYSALSLRPTKQIVFDRKTAASITYLHKELAIELSKRSYLFHQIIINSIKELNIQADISIDLNPTLLIELLYYRINLDDLRSSNESESISSIKRKMINTNENYASMIEAFEQKPPPSLASNYLDHTTYSQLHRTSICRIKSYHQIKHDINDKYMLLTSRDIKNFFTLVNKSKKRTYTERMIDASKKTGITLSAIQRDCNLQ